MKKSILPVIILLAIGCNSMQKKEDSRAAKMVKKMTEVCQLTPAQASRIQPALENMIKTRIENKDKYASNQVALFKADSACRKDYLDTLQNILTPEQFEKLKAFQAQRKSNRQGGKDGQQDNGQD